MAKHNSGDTAVADISTFQQSIAGKYLTFYLADEEYGIEILKVQEIIQMQRVTSIPNVPSFVRGIINLRGKVIPVMELRAKFGMDRIEDTEKTAIVVCTIEHEDTIATTGLIIDNVKEVTDLDARMIEHPPSFGQAVDTEFIMGICKSDLQVTILLDVDKIVTNGELSALSTLSE